MKALNLSKLMFVFALALGAMAFWTAAAPSVANADSFLGGWILDDRCPAPCIYSDEEPCSEGPDWTHPFCTNGDDTIVCVTDDDGDYECSPKENGAPPSGEDRCDTAMVDCPGAETPCD